MTTGNGAPLHRVRSTRLLEVILRISTLAVVVEPKLGEREAPNLGCRGDPEHRLVLGRDSGAEQQAALVLALVVAVWVFLQPWLSSYVLIRECG